jgi:hypothetical protein
MVITSNQKQFQAHPAGQFRAVCVDSTEPKQVETRFGTQTQFKFVWETEAKREDGTPMCVWSRPLTPSLHEKSNLRKTLRQWRGRDLTAEESRGFDTESMIGVPAIIVVTQEERDGVTYGNIVAVMPDNGPNPLEPSGKFIRQKDRPAKDAAWSGTSPAKSPPAVAHTGWRAVVVHIGANKGRMLGDLSEAQREALFEKWVPTIADNASVEDHALREALEECFDNIPY